MGMSRPSAPALVLGNFSGTLSDKIDLILFRDAGPGGAQVRPRQGYPGGP